MKYLIIGCGPAGAFTAKSLRTSLPEEEITLFDCGMKGLYARMRLPEFLCGTLPEEKMILSGKEAFERLGICCCFGREVITIDRVGKRIVLCDGKTYSYDRLILATGAAAAVPPVKGIEECDPYVLRSLEDAVKIRTKCQNGVPEGVLVIGGGLLGLEAAASLAKLSSSVTVAECSERLLPHNLTEKESLLVQKKLEETGSICFKLGTMLASVRKTEEGTMECTFADGSVKKCSLLLFSAGIRPRVKLALEAGLDVGRGIRVDRTLQTSDENIYAVGDCAEYDGKVPGLWLAAKDQAAALAGILSGKLLDFEMPIYKPELKVPGVSMKEIRSAAEEN